ncbi:glutamate--cysteine ligase [Nocardioides sp.]|uniref:carboxylate-amine ligase n=1 Tax=Nocardioides sp. TaxID=35761 RepID=UPI00273522A8|nr:glutamate--cysteine ligase [Nocardioides sp.]MDP3889991.1 glutamate--cysteine ligase [Nocardioides sp.]
MRTIGVEEELILVDLTSGRPRSVAAQVLHLAEDREARERGGSGDGAGGSLGHELHQQQVETDTPPERDLARLEAALREWRDRARVAAQEAGSRVIASATSPFPMEPQLVPDERFEKMAEHFGLTVDEQLSCGCHVHVSVDSDEEAIGVLDRIRVWMPTLLALSANSPFWQGQDSGYASFRSQVLPRWPSHGPTELFGSARAYREHVEAMVGTGVLLDEGMVYSDARPSHHLPTLEIRAADVCLDVRDTVLIAALSRGLVETAARAWSAGEPADPTPVSMLRLASWQAGRHGLTGDLVDPRTGKPAAARAVVEELVEHVRPALRDAGDLAAVELGVDRTFARGNGAVRQREVLERTGQLGDVVAALARVTAGQEE